jgi:hypothetical protein
MDVVVVMVVAGSSPWLAWLRRGCSVAVAAAWLSASVRRYAAEMAGKQGKMQGLSAFGQTPI